METPRGRTVEVIAGDPDLIQTRASQISELATGMTDAATTLKGIEDGSVRGLGYAMDKIREVIDGAHVDLAEAGRRYEPAGTVLSAYAAALRTAQTEMKPVVADCEDSQGALWGLYDAERAAKDAYSRDSFAHMMEPADSPDYAAHERRNDRLREAAEDAATAVRLEREALAGHLRTYDAVFDTWETAYNTAVDDLEDANKIGEDSTWENIAGVIAVVAEVLSWVGLAVAVLGLIIGGPFFAALAIIVAVVSLALTVALMFDGRKGWGDLAWSIVGILPIGKLGMLFKRGGQLKFLGEIGKNITKPFQQMRAMKGLSFVPRTGWSAKWLTRFDAYAGRVTGTRLTGPFTLRGLAERFVGGTNRSFTIAFTRAVESNPQAVMKPVLERQMAPVLRNLVGSAPTALEQVFNVYKWTDRVISIGNGRPSGAISPAGALNGLF